MKQIKTYFLSFLFIVIIFFASGCAKNTSANISQTRIDFDQFINSIFIKEVQSDSITLNYTLAHPEHYGIKNTNPTFGSYTIEDMEKELALSENYYTKLKTFAYSSLTEEQQQTYDVLEKYLSLDKKAGEFLLYNEALSPTTGIQAQLPVLLAEFNFYTKEDIETYLNLLPQIYDYFKQIAEFEQEKSKAGLFMSDQTADDICKQCNDFIQDKENNYLINIFNDKIEDFKDVSTEKKESWKLQNKKAITDFVIPAYEFLSKTLETLKESGINKKGLCYFPEGKNYYEYLVAISTGSDRSITNLKKLVNSYLRNSVTKMSEIAASDSSIYKEIENIEYPEKEPAKIIEYLQNNISKDFPALQTVQCTIKYVHPSLQDSLSPAFYLSPPIDDFEKNNIYINRSESYALTNLFTTLAHEGYPGHLYQNVYYRRQNPHPVRTLLSFSGYSEGWATYVELYSYHLANLPENIVTMLENNMIATLCMYARTDIGIHYDGWDNKQTSYYLNQFGITDTTTIEDIYNFIVAEPTNYLKYTIGYLEFMELREKAKDKLNDKFILKDFHQFLLEIGPANFSTIEKHMNSWIKSQK